ncbi:MAG: hypothetical protein M9962_14210 [Oligoflexia bacterium]|nr:hypothetical protein [Oligoflexia bacterium]
MITTISAIRIFNQLKWISFRIEKIVAASQSHFGKEKVQKIITSLGKAPLNFSSDLEDVLDEKDLSDFIRDLSEKIEIYEAKVISALCEHASPYQSHVRDQVLFGASIAGQEAARSVMGLSSEFARPKNIPELTKVVMLLTYNGPVDTRYYFISYRQFGSTSVHYSQSPHLRHWQKANADPLFLYEVKTKWIQGILDVLAPNTHLITSSSIEKGDRFGLIHFMSSEKNVQANAN